MATAKKKSRTKQPLDRAPKKKAPRKGARTGPPKGMKEVVGGYAKSWDVEEFDTLHGTVATEIKTVELTQGRKKVDRRCVEVKTDDGERYTLWESAGLVSLFEAIEAAKLPCTVWVQYKGLGKAKKGQNAPKLFDAAIS